MKMILRMDEKEECEKGDISRGVRETLRFPGRALAQKIIFLHCNAMPYQDNVHVTLKSNTRCIIQRKLKFHKFKLLGRCLAGFEN